MKQDIGINDNFGRLKRVLLGHLDHATVPDLEPSIRATIPKQQQSFFQRNKGKPFPLEYVDRAQKELENFKRNLEKAGVIVDRPNAIDFSQPIKGANWEVESGLYAAMPRDILLVMGKTIIVSPLSWRCRQRESEAYEKNLIEYESLGFHVIRAPKPILNDNTYNQECLTCSEFESVITNHEPLFDAADFIVFNRHIIGQISHTTNLAGIDWLKEHIPESYQLSIVELNDPKPMHIDASLVVLRDGLMMVNPERVDIKSLKSSLPEEIQSWEYIKAPHPEVLPDDPPKFMTSNWISMNLFILDSKTVFVEEKQTQLRKLLERHKLEVISLPFRYFQCFGGSFHCATQEIIRE